MAKNVLGISWFHGQFHAVNIAGVTTRAAWSSPDAVTSAREFSTALSTAVRETRFTAHRVVVVVDHRNLLFHVQETPPAKGKTLAKLLTRLVAQNQFFDEAATHGHIELPVSKSHHRHLLSLLPQSLPQAIDDACANQGLVLTALLPSAAVLAPRLKTLPAPADEVVILATELGLSMNLLLGRADGTLLFSRTVVLGAGAQTERAAQEINRTLHYAQQQFGATVNQLFTTGTGACAALKDAPIRTGLRVQESSPAEGSNDLAQLAVALSAKTPLNFARKKSNRSAVQRGLAATGLAAALAISATTTYQIETQVRARERVAVAAEQRLRDDEAALTANNALRLEARHLNAFIQLVGRTNDAPVAALFARYLPSIIPSNIRLTEVRVSEAAAGWSFHLKGILQSDVVDPDDVLARLESSLQASLFQAKVTDSTHQQLFRGDDENGNPRASRGAGRQAEQPFFLTGIIP